MHIQDGLLRKERRLPDGIALRPATETPSMIDLRYSIYIINPRRFCATTQGHYRQSNNMVTNAAQSTGSSSRIPFPIFFAAPSAPALSAALARCSRKSSSPARLQGRGMGREFERGQRQLECRKPVCVRKFWARVISLFDKFLRSILKRSRYSLTQWI